MASGERGCAHAPTITQSARRGERRPLRETRSLGGANCGPRGGARAQELGRTAAHRRGRRHRQVQRRRTHLEPPQDGQGPSLRTVTGRSVRNIWFRADNPSSVQRRITPEGTPILLNDKRSQGTHDVRCTRPWIPLRGDDIRGRHHNDKIKTSSNREKFGMAVLRMRS